MPSEEEKKKEGRLTRGGRRRKRMKRRRMGWRWSAGASVQGGGVIHVTLGRLVPGTRKTSHK
jgi:hypothetical protein